ncbi:FAD-binding domain protein [Ceratobasidium sp. AG-Ba]|nr:FAD-binding domain protein [Ceratobasidium sp. AG-Ba]
MFAINLDALATLRSRLSLGSSVHLKDESGYNVRRWAENAEKPAAAVAYPATIDDVVELLAFAQGKGTYAGQPQLDIAVKGGGHSASGASSSDGGLVLDLESQMNTVRVDAQKRLAYVGGGALWKHVDQAAAEHELAPVAGVVSHTGVGDLTLGGGRGWLTGQHGLVIDNLVQATVVTASGAILTASEAENNDLYWALRGGGGNFGVVTEFVFRLHPQRPTVFHHFFVFGPRSLHPLIEEINAWLRGRDDTESGSLVFALCPAGTPVVVLQMIYNGDSLEGRQRFQRFVDLGPMMHKPETIPYIKLNQLQDVQSAHGQNKLLRGNFIPATPIGFPPQLIKTLFDSWLDFVCTNPIASKSTILIELYHPDKVASIPATATAFASRLPNYAVLMTIHWSDPSFTPRASTASVQVDEAFKKARALAFSAAQNVGEAYVNYLDEDSRAGASKARIKFGPNYTRLVEAKLKYDPERVFGKWFAMLDSKRRESKCSTEAPERAAFARETAVQS